MRVSKKKEYTIRGYLDSMKNRPFVRWTDSGFETLEGMYLRIKRVAQSDMQYMSVYCADDDTYDCYRVRSYVSSYGTTHYKFAKV